MDHRLGVISASIMVLELTGRCSAHVTPRGRNRAQNEQFQQLLLCKVEIFVSLQQYLAPVLTHAGFLRLTFS